MPIFSVRAGRTLLLTSLLIWASGAFVSDSYAGQPAERRTTPTPAQTTPAREVPVRDIDAQATRDQLIQVLIKHPPAVARVLKLDPSLMRNDSYLEAYPGLREFLALHPEIPQNASFYLDNIRVYDGNREPPNQQVELVENTLSGLAAVAGGTIFVGTLIWLIRTVLDQRRWSRLSKIQAEVHSKLMDRFSSNDELLTYVQTPSGKRFLESGPSPLEETPRTIGAPFSRILWSVQIGVVLLVTGIGLMYVSTRTIEEAREMFFILGCLSLAVGAGFSVSAAASYLISRKLGLFDRPASSATDHA